MEWQDISTAPRDGTNIWVLDGNGKRFIADYDDSCGYFQMIFCIDGLESVKFSQEFGRIYNAVKWMPLPPTNSTGG